MRMNAVTMKLFILLSLMMLVTSGIAEAHGTPTLAVKQPTTTAGGTLSISGDGIGEAGESVLLTLQGATLQVPLGTITLTSDAFEDARFTIPRDAPPGGYIIALDNGPIHASAQVEVVSTDTTAANHAAAASTGASRVWTPFDWVVAIGLVVLSLAVAVALLWRSRSDLAAIDW